MQAIEKLCNQWDSNSKPLNHKGSFLPLCYINCSRAGGIEFLKFQWSFWLVVKLWWFCARASDFTAKSATRCLSFCNNGCKKDNLLSSIEAKKSYLSNGQKDEKLGAASLIKFVIAGKISFCSMLLLLQKASPITWVFSTLSRGLVWRLK